MHSRLYSEGAPYGDSVLISELIEATAPEGVDIIFTFLNDGINATMHLRPPHNASWNITWNMNFPTTLDTGDEHNPRPCIADPRTQEVLTEQFESIRQKMFRFCDCSHCRKRLR